MSHVRMPFGKHRGKLLGDVPDGYLSWLLRECDLDDWLRQAVEEEMRFRYGEPAAGTAGPRQQSSDASPRAFRGGTLIDLKTTVQRWYWSLCMKYHPDRGGSTEVMQAINDAHERLRRLLGVS
jgi:hypothetical protein